MLGDFSEQDFQLLEALSKRILSIEKDRNENDEEFVISVSDRDRLNKVRTLCKRSKHYPFIDKFFSTIFTSVFIKNFLEKNSMEFFRRNQMI